MAAKNSRLTRQKIDPLTVLGEVGDSGAGAVVLFLGTVRDKSEAGEVVTLEYEAYVPMAEKSLARAEREVRRMWPATKAVKVLHRTGTLEVGDISVAVAVSSPHRAEAFAGCRHAMEIIKTEAPIWKREKLATGRQVWVEGKRLRGPRKKSRVAKAN